MVNVIFVFCHHSVNPLLFIGGCVWDFQKIIEGGWKKYKKGGWAYRRGGWL